MVFSRSRTFALQVAPLRQQKPQAVAAFRLDVGPTEPAGAHNMRQAERIRRIRLVALCRHRRAHMLGLQTDRWQAALNELRLQPGRQRSGFMTGAPQPRQERLKDRRNCIWIGHNVRLHLHLALVVDHADRRPLHRHVES
jgi:hypothetical protein